MNELKAKRYMTKLGGASKSDHDCIVNIYTIFVDLHAIKLAEYS